MPMDAVSGSLRSSACACSCARISFSDKGKRNEGGEMAQEPSRHQIADRLRQQIDNGSLGPCALLPSESELARSHGVSRQTARAALQILEQEDSSSCGPGAAGSCEAQSGQPVAEHTQTGYTANDKSRQAHGFHHSRDSLILRYIIRT